MGPIHRLNKNINKQCIINNNGTKENKLSIENINYIKQLWLIMIKFIII